MKRSATVLALAGAAVMIGGSATAAQPEFAQMNHPSYWGEDCEKWELDEDVYDYYVEFGAELVIIKAGRERDVLTAVTAATWLSASNGKAISHVIVCGEGEYGGGDDGGDGES